MNTIGERIREIRKANGLTMDAFAKRIGISGGAVSLIESGKTETPSNQTIVIICREFGVNEIWLRTGEGEMFQAMTEDEELAAYLGDIMHDEPESFRRRFTLEMKNWTPEVWQMLGEICKRLATEKPDTE